MRKSSRQVVFVNTNPPEDRVFLLKPQNVIDNLKDDEENIQASSLIDKYEKRPDSLENICLADFACWYDSRKLPSQTHKVPKKKTSTDDFLPEDGDFDNEEDHPPENNTNEDHPTDNGIQGTKDYKPQDYSTYHLQRRKVNINMINYIHHITIKTNDTFAAHFPLTHFVNNNPNTTFHFLQTTKILRTCHFNKDTDSEKYYRELIMLYSNWRTEDKLIDSAKTYEERYQQVQYQ
jgi:hypothetical protein